MEWKEYKRTSWEEATYWERSVIKMEIKFQNYLRSLYLKRYNTTIPISMNNRKLKAIAKILVFEPACGSPVEIKILAYSIIVV